MTEYRSRLRRRKRPSALLLPPPILHQRYTLDKEIGHGGCARVYRAWDNQQGKFVALKRAYRREKHCEALFYEAEVLSTLRHPALPSFIDSFEEEGRAYLVETWLDGTPMKHLRSFELKQVLWIGQQLCAVLAYLHQHHLVHRDIAPGNILLDMEHQTLSLIDFGLARLFLPSASLPGASEVLQLTAGTPGYVAPEQWEQGTVSPAADIYSLGMVLGCALTDCKPQEIVAVPAFADLWEDPRDIPGELLPLLALLDRMIARNREQRPSLSEVARVLSRLKTDEF
jgi:serine/threonine protein kinase